MDKSETQNLSPLKYSSYQENRPQIKTKYIVIFISVLAVVSFGSTTYLLIGGNQTQKPPFDIQPSIIAEPTMAPTPTPAGKDFEVTQDEEFPPEPTPDPTATWSAFINSKYHYSIKHPSDWKILKQVSTDPKILDYQLLYPKGATGSAYGVSITYSTRTYTDALAIDGTVGEPIVIGTISATKKRLEDSGKAVSFKVIIPYKTNSIILFAKEAYKEIFDLIVNSFKLI